MSNEELEKKWREEAWSYLYDKTPKNADMEKLKAYRSVAWINDYLSASAGVDRVETYLEAKRASQVEIEQLKSELTQQRFNNKNNLSIGQKVSDEIQQLKKLIVNIVKDQSWPDYMKHVDEAREFMKSTKEIGLEQ